MAKSSEPQSRVLSLQEMEEGIRLLEARLKDLNELDLLTISNRTDPRIDGIEAAIGDTLSHVFGHVMGRQSTNSIEPLLRSTRDHITMRSKFLGNRLRMALSMAKNERYSYFNGP
jgi:hypothetical protein